ncbi:thioredoxin family protein [Verrucomicrobiaceae bacterium N1E253]|uniref:Thioredoxin family protein n=1 Tax=Oceaniferula marina TaxID=2748318 RepID=A0A851GG92_9BACT|nr:thioredoxin family protein [Oceaniferula marina]NWK54285.1 thioredoxin family protein [Oceaniferula marina]
MIHRSPLAQLRYLASIFALAALCILPVSAQFDPFSDGLEEKEKTEAALISEVSKVAPGERFFLGVRLKHSEGWHSYFKNPGGPGLPLEFDWKLPEGFSLVKLHWPTPHLYSSAGIQFYVYEGEYTLLAEIQAPANTQAGKEIRVGVSPTWQLCDDKGCDPPQSKDLEITIPLAETTEKDAEQVAFFKKAREALPVKNIPWELSVSEQGGSYIFELTPNTETPQELTDLYFISSDQQSNGSSAQKLTKNDDGTYTLTASKAKETGNGAEVIHHPHLSGILYNDAGWNGAAKGFIVDELEITKKPLEAAGIGKLLGILGGMLIGGLILNLMPCVFPVIGLKIMGFAQQAGEAKSKVVLHGVAFAAGVLISFWVIAGLLLSLRNKALDGSGEDVGWGYQLQNPFVVLTILLLMFILALNMFGVFEIGTSATGVGGKLQSKQGLQGSFFSGVLATVVATPCSAPFLGAAIGAAFALPNVQFMLSFTAMALGLALPYLFLSIFPHLVEKLPRPGPWMESFKQGMSFLLFATAGYLLWIYVAQTGMDYMLNVVLGLSIIAMALWVYGRWNLPHKSGKARNIARGLTLAGLALGLFACWPPDTSNKIKWEKWSEAKVEQLLENDTPVFVDFTATWCATCQVNKKTAYTDEVVDLFKRYGVVALKADKTSPDPEIEKKLQELGRTAIPVNVLYIPGVEEPIITPEILTPDYMKRLITENLEKPDSAE